MTTTDNKPPRAEVYFPHPDGDVVLELTATYRGDIRKVVKAVEGASKEDVENAVAAQFFKAIQDATQGDDAPASDGATETKD